MDKPKENTETPMNLFISHSGKDRELIHKYLEPILHRLQAEIQMFNFKDTVGGGISYDIQIEQGIASCDIFIVVVTENSNKVVDGHSYVLNEIKIARDSRKPILPILVDQANYGVLNLELKSIQPSFLEKKENYDPSSIENALQKLFGFIGDNIPIETDESDDTQKKDSSDSSIPPPPPPPKFPLKRFYKSHRLVLNVIVWISITLLVIAFLHFWSNPTCEISIDSVHKIRFDSVGGEIPTFQISGKVKCANAENKRIVLFARTDYWYIQPNENNPLTRIEEDGSWIVETHFGYQYCILLVDNSFRPILKSSVDPTQLAGVITYKTVRQSK